VRDAGGNPGYGEQEDKNQSKAAGERDHAGQDSTRRQACGMCSVVAKAEIEKEAVIAAVNRCATQNQAKPKSEVFPQPARLGDDFVQHSGFRRATLGRTEKVASGVEGYSSEARKHPSTPSPAKRCRILSLHVPLAPGINS